MSLANQLISITTKSKKRLGRGAGSGKGSHTVGRGVKGHTSRVGKGTPLWFEGGQLPLIKRLPMQRGKARFEVVNPSAEVSLNALQKMKADVITLETFKLEGVVPQAYKKAKIILSGQIKRAVTIKGVKVSQAAQVAIEKQGGQVEK